MKESKEWFVPAPWGNIAVISWGSPSGVPVLMVHGRQDSAATFVPLVECLPDKYYYVAIDLPGNGKSDSPPTGLPIWRYCYLGAVDIVVNHLKWLKFIYIGHSMGCELGLFFNGIKPGMITKMIHFDAVPSFQRLQNRHPDKYFKKYFEDFYNDYEKNNNYYKIYTKRKVLDAVKRARDLNEELAELILERNLIALGDDQYRLSWGRRTASCIPQNYPNEYYAELFKSSPPSILFHMSDGSKGYTEGLEESLQLVEMLKSRTNMQVYEVTGDHDAHLRPGAMAGIAARFLEEGRRSKL